MLLHPTENEQFKIDHFKHLQSMETKGEIYIPLKFLKYFYTIQNKMQSLRHVLQVQKYFAAKY